MGQWSTGYIASPENTADELLQIGEDLSDKMYDRRQSGSVCLSCNLIEIVSHSCQPSDLLYVFIGDMGFDRCVKGGFMNELRYGHPGIIGAIYKCVMVEVVKTGLYGVLASFILRHGRSAAFLLVEINFLCHWQVSIRGTEGRNEVKASPDHRTWR